MDNYGEIIIYQTEDGMTKLDVRNVFLGPDILGIFGGLGFIIIDIVLIMVIRNWKKDEVLC